MSRTIATVKRPAPHPYHADPGLPGYCTCGLLKRNGVHSAEQIDARAAELAQIADRTSAAQAEHRRRIGEAP